MRRPRLLDLFCGAGGCSAGYHRVGFDVVGVDIEPQPRYPFLFAQSDALSLLRWLLDGHGFQCPNDPKVKANGGPFDLGKHWSLSDFDAIHASPPCQAYSKARHTPGSVGREYPDLLRPTIDLLDKTGLPWVVENVPGAPMPGAAELCGTMFGLRVRRHRLFLGSFLVLSPSNPCCHRDGDLTVFGHCVQVTGTRGTAYVAKSGRTHYRPLRVGNKQGGEAMGIDWMNRGELSQAIPPAYCEFVGRQLLAVVGAGS